MASSTLAPDEVPISLQRWWSDRTPGLDALLYRPDAGSLPGLSLDNATTELRNSALSAPDHLVPVSFVDDWSLACLATSDDSDYGWSAGHVVRWHLDGIDPCHQGALLDTDIDSFVPSLLEEFGPAWSKGYRGMMKLSKRYQQEFVEPQVTPKAHDLRPFQLACQNVIIGLAAFKQQVSIDGEAAPYWLTCEAPHVATYEGSRTLSALLLCDAFQSGGTMEVTFADHAEGKVPASLRRFARTRGIKLGAEIAGGQSISPSEARALFLAVTPMPADLHERCERLIRSGAVSAERMCYTLLSAVWSAASLDFLAACASGERLQSILSGGSDVFDRPNRVPEMELARAAVLLDTFIRRVDAKDTATSTDGKAVRLFEDTTHGVTWRVLDHVAAVDVTGLEPGAVPWHPSLTATGRLLLLPRPHPIRDDFELARRLAASDIAGGAPVAVLTSMGSPATDDGEIAVLKCPVRLAEIDLQVERSLLSSTLGRA